MYLTSAFVSLLAVASASILPRLSSTTQNNLATVDNDTKSLTSSISAWDGSVAGGAAIQNKEQTLESDLKTAANDIKSLPTLSSSDASSIKSYLCNPLAPDVVSLCNAFYKRKSSFTSAGLSATYNNDIKNLKTLFDDLYNSAAAKAGTQASAIGTCRQQIDDACSQACPGC